MIPCAVALLFVLLSPPAVAAPLPGETLEAPDGVLIAHGPADLSDQQLARKAAARLFTAGAGRFEPSQVQRWTTLAAPNGSWIGAVPSATCPDSAEDLTLSQLTSDLGSAQELLAFVRLPEARALLEGLVDKLPCAGGIVEKGDLYDLWFRLGALEFLEGREAEALVLLARAAMVDTTIPFDESFEPALRDLLVRAKEDVISRRKARVVVLRGQADVYQDGTRADLAEGRGSLELRVGTHLLQVVVAGDVETRVVSLDGLPVREGVAVLAIADQATLDGALGDFFTSDGPTTLGGAMAQGLLFAWLAEQGLPWALVVDAGSASSLGEPQVLQVDSLTARSGPYEGRPARGDRFTRRARASVYIAWRGQQTGVGVDDPARSYFEWTLGLWTPVSWVARVGVTLGFAHTAVPEAEGSCCTLPELGFRARAEWPTGWFRPFVEGGFLVLWPYSFDEAKPTTSGPNHPVWGVEGWVGGMWTPGRERRIGFNTSIGLGVASEIRGWLKLRVGTELRF